MDEAHVWGMSSVTLIILMNHYSCRSISDEDVDEPQLTRQMCCCSESTLHLQQCSCPRQPPRPPMFPSCIIDLLVIHTPMAKSQVIAQPHSWRCPIHLGLQYSASADDGARNRVTGGQAFRFQVLA
jgi:hypothetical protein